jgi:S1-C subfamily serine protease
MRRKASSRRIVPIDWFAWITVGIIISQVFPIIPRSMQWLTSSLWGVAFPKGQQEQAYPQETLQGQSDDSGVTYTAAETSAAVPAGVPETIARARASTVTIVHPSIHDIENAPERGSGVIIDASKGLILTARHVVVGINHLGQTSTYNILTNDKRHLTARLIGFAPNRSNPDPMRSFTDDMAVLQIENPPSNLVAAPLASSSNLPSGTEVWTIGAPICRLVATPDNCGIGQLRRTQVVDMASLDAFRQAPMGGGPGMDPRQSSAGSIDRMVMVRGGINPKTGKEASPAKGGSSGGGMFNNNGELIGIVVMAGQQTEMSAPIAQQDAGAVPIETIKPFLQKYLTSSNLPTVSAPSPSDMPGPGGNGGYSAPPGYGPPPGYYNAPGFAPPPGYYDAPPGYGPPPGYYPPPGYRTYFQ